MNFDLATQPKSSGYRSASGPEIWLKSQVSLKALFLGLAVLCAWLAAHCERLREQRLAIEGIARVRGRVEYDWQRAGRSQPPGPRWLKNVLGEDFFAVAVGVNFQFEPQRAGDAETEHIARLPELETLDLEKTRLTDLGLARLGRLRKLRWLSLRKTPVSGAGIAELRNLTVLQHLDLRGVGRWGTLEPLAAFANLKHLDLTSAGLEGDQLRGLEMLSALTWLSLGDNPNISDPGLQRLAGLRRVEELYLPNTGITDAGLESLANLKRLKTLDVHGTRVTQGGVAKLLQALPQLTVFPASLGSRTKTE